MKNKIFTNGALSGSLKYILVIILVFIFSLSNIHAEAQSNSASGNDRLTVKIAVFGPGDELYLWWGHMALVVEDRARGVNRIYDWGVFSFNQDNFIPNFALGRLYYLCLAGRAEDTYRRYTADNRDITLYTLNLAADEKQKMYDYAEWNARPENQIYLYHHFKNNCVTRILNLLDTAVQGQFYEKYNNEAGRYTLREHVRRYTYFNSFGDWFLNYLMGENIDGPTTKSDEMYLPSEVARNIVTFDYKNANGETVALVSNIEVLNKSVNRPLALEKPRIQWIREGALGLLIACILCAVAFLKPDYKKARNILWGGFNIAFGAFFGLAGSLTLFMQFTDHDYCHLNFNLIFINPLLLISIPLGIIYLSAKTTEQKLKAETRLSILWCAVFILSMITLGIKLLPQFYQQNQVTIALIAPIALALGGLPALRYFLLNATKR